MCYYTIRKGKGKPSVRLAEWLGKAEMLPQTRRKEKENKKMKSYSEMSLAELRRTIDRIDGDLRNFPSMSHDEKMSLNYERGQAMGVFLRKITAILDECDENA